MEREQIYYQKYILKKDLVGGADKKLEEVIKRQPGLSTGDFNGIVLGADGVSELTKHIPPTLETLDLSYTFVDGVEGARAIVSVLKKLKKLKTLNLSANTIGDEGATEIADALPPTLETLFLDSLQIEKDSAKAIAEKLLELQSLKKLSLASNNIGDVGAIAIANALPPTLETLILNNNLIGDAGATAIAGALPPTFETLVLYFNRIGNAGATAIAKKLPELQSLKYLDLRHNNIKDDGADKIFENLISVKALETLKLQYNYLSFIKILDWHNFELESINRPGNLKYERYEDILIPQKDE